MSETTTEIVPEITGEKKIYRPSIESLMETSGRLERLGLYLSGEGATRETIFTDDPRQLFDALRLIQDFLRHWRGHYYQAMPYVAYKAGIAEHPSAKE